MLDLDLKMQTLVLYAFHQYNDNVDIFIKLAFKFRNYSWLKKKQHNKIKETKEYYSYKKGLK